MLKGSIRRYLVAGLLVWVPLGVTVALIKFLVDIMDATLLLLPDGYRPENLLGFHVPGMGIVLVTIVVFLTGVVVANLFGRKLVLSWERVLARIPLVRSIYSSVKQVAETMLSGSGKSFHKVVMVEYPRREVWTLAFITGKSWDIAQQKTGGDLVSIYVPTTPNPTSGFFLMVPPKDIIELDISVDEGLKMIISMGVVLPVNAQQDLPAAGSSTV